jgi:hypothetical protein
MTGAPIRLGPGASRAFADIGSHLANRVDITQHGISALQAVTRTVHPQRGGKERAA